MLLTALLAVKEPFSSYLKYQEITTDNAVFRLHCLLTAAALLSASILLTTTQLIGNPIECYSGKDVAEERQHAINTFCWVKGAFRMPIPSQHETVQHRGYSQNDPYGYYGNSIVHMSAQSQHQQNSGYNRADMNAPYPGVLNEYDSEGPKKYYPYYQWVCFILFFQAILCYLPKALWNKCEGGLMMKLASGLHCYCPGEERMKRTDIIIQYLERYRRGHKYYVLMYWFCEILCLVNVAFQMWMMNTFLDGEFTRVGVNALARMNKHQDERLDPLIYVFPRMTKCTYNAYGPSGGIVNYDSLCILPQNVMNEKIFIFLWFWFIALAIMFCLQLIYRLMMAFLPGYRPQLLAARTRLGRSSAMFTVAGNLDLGDWWLLYMLAKNMSPLIYKDFIRDLAKIPDTHKNRLYPDIGYLSIDTVDSPKKILD